MGNALAIAVAASLTSVLAHAESPSLLSLEPDAVLPYQPLTLRLVGRGFRVGATVYVEGSLGGRFLPYQPVAVEEETLEVELPLGFAPTPRERGVCVKNPGGSTSSTLQLRVGELAARETTGAPAAESGETLAPASPGVPSIREIRPSSVPPGSPVLLEIYGSGFTDGARVELTVNLRAGSTELPEYAPKAFEAEWIDQGLLELELQRGFYPVPAARDLVVVNPDGSRSEPADSGE
jgi:hypothetical protein